MRTTIFTAFGFLAAVGCCIFLILKSQQKSDQSNIEKEEKSTALGNFREIGISIVNSFKSSPKITKIYVYANRTPRLSKGTHEKNQKIVFFPSIIYRSHPCKLRKKDIKNFRKFISQEQHNIIQIKGVKLSVFKLTLEIVR